MMDFNEIVTHTGMWVWVLIALAALWFIIFIPSAIKNYALKREWKCAEWLDKHIVIIEIVWIAALLFVGWYFQI